MTDINANSREFMSKVYIYICALMLVIGLVACRKEMSPLTSGALTYPDRNGSFAKKELSADQLQKLSLWLEKHSDNWSGCYATPTKPLFSITLQHVNGQSSSLMLLSYEGTLRASYLGGSNKSDQPCAFLTVTKQETNELQALLFLENKP